jgi:hypothetical protein
MSHTNQELKEALGVIWALVYRATQVPHLSPDQTEKLQNALRINSTGRDGDDFFNRRAAYLCDCVLSCGVVSVPSPGHPKARKRFWRTANRSHDTLTGSNDSRGSPAITNERSV